MNVAASIHRTPVGAASRFRSNDNYIDFQGPIAVFVKESHDHAEAFESMLAIDTGGLATRLWTLNYSAAKQQKLRSRIRQNAPHPRMPLALASAPEEPIK